MKRDAATSILLIGTCDTKAPEMAFLREVLEREGGRALLMDVGVLGRTPLAVEVSADQVAAAAGTTLAALASLGDENAAMKAMACGAAMLAQELAARGEIAGVLMLGGTMGTDLALDVAAALPLGLPKGVVSTVAFSPLIPPARIAPDLMMFLWAGGLYGLNDICRNTLAQAAAAVLGAARAAQPAASPRPMIGMTSLGRSCLAYMTWLKPALESRGYELAIFHTTGMGGRAFEALAARGQFVAVMDFSLQEVSNATHGSVVNSGADRLSAAGRAGIPQLVAPGAVDMIDLPAWQPVPPALQGRAMHTHNRLIASVLATPQERRATAQAVAQKLGAARGPVAMLLPLAGIEEWDRAGAPLHDAVAHQEFCAEMRAVLAPPARLLPVQAHINDEAFAAAALEVFDAWVAAGVVPRGAA